MYPPVSFSKTSVVARLFLALSLFLLLTACAAEATPIAEATDPPAATETPIPPTATPVPPTETPAPTEPPAETEAETETEAEAEVPTATPVPATPEPALTVRTFQIVPAESEAQYEVEEEFFNRDIQFFTAVGVTQDITGSFSLAVQGETVSLEQGAFNVDLRTLQTDSPRRDNAIRTRWLESNTYPLAQFTATELQNFPAAPTEGESINFTLSGDMTIREVTQPLDFEVTAELNEGQIAGTANTFLYMRDFGFEPPSILNALEVTDGVTVTVRFVAEEQ